MTATEQAEFDFSEVPTNTAECRPPGIYRDVPFEEYASWRAINSGVIRWGKVSMKHFRAAYDGLIKSDDTKDRKLGRAIHQRVLEPDRHLLVATQCGALTAKGARCSNLGYRYFEGEWFCGVKGHAPAEAVEPEDYVSEDEAARIEKIVAALHDHPAMPMLKRNGWSEVSIVWEWNGLLLKGRLDRYAEGPPPVVLDMKSCQVGKGTMEDCRKSIINYCWHMQAAIYCKGIQAHTGMLPSMIWLFQEKDQPFDTQIVMATPEEIEIAWEETAERLSAFKRCQESGEWPGYVKVLRDGRIAGEPGCLPVWYLQQRQGLKA